MTKTEKRYAPLDQELLAVYFAVKRYSIYLYGHDFITYTDHKPLIYLKTFKDIVNKRFRWIQYLEELGAKLVHVPGRENVMADFISRNIKETPPWKAINCFAIEFNNLLYRDNEIREVQRADNDILTTIKSMEDINNENVKKEVPLEYRKDMHKLLLNDGIL